MWCLTGSIIRLPAWASPPKNMMALGEVIATALARVCPNISPVNSNNSRANTSPVCAASVIIFAVMLPLCSLRVVGWSGRSPSHISAVITIPVADA